MQTGQIIPLGYGNYVLSDEVVAVQPIVEGRGPGRRTAVWVRGVPEAIIGSRAEDAIIHDLVTPADDAARSHQQRAFIQLVLKTLDGVQPVLRRVIREENGIDLEALAGDARKVLG